MVSTIPSAHTITKFTYNFKLNFKHILELLSMLTSSDLCLWTQLAMSISPQGLNLDMYLSNFREIVTLSWPKRNKVVDDQ